MINQRLNATLLRGCALEQSVTVCATYTPRDPHALRLLVAGGGTVHHLVLDVDVLDDGAMAAVVVPSVISVEPFGVESHIAITAQDLPAGSRLLLDWDEVADLLELVEHVRSSLDLDELTSAALQRELGTILGAQPRTTTT